MRFFQYEPRSRPSFPEIVQTLDNLIAAHSDESKDSLMTKRQSVDQELMSSMSEMSQRQSRPMCRQRSVTARLRSHSADARAQLIPGPHPAPCDKARCHSARRVAELASRRDPHYRPMTANPFHALGGVKKILGDLFSSCLELPSLENVVKHAQQDDCGVLKSLDRKKPNSEPSSPTARKKWERKVCVRLIRRSSR